MMRKRKFSPQVMIALREREVCEALRFVDCISVEDYIVWMLGDPPIVTSEHRDTAVNELRSAGFGLGKISLWGHRAIFPRYMRHPANINQLARWEAAEAIYD